MHGFTQYTPTRIIFGKATQKQAGELAKRFGATKVFVVYGGGLSLIHISEPTRH